MSQLQKREVKDPDSIAVVIPAYNAEGYIAETLRSVLEQTRRPAEIVVVDDCSTDGTVSVAEQFLPDVTILRNSDNAGPGARRNQGARHATSRVVAFLDADDVWNPDHLETVAGLLDLYPDAGVAYSRSRLFGLRDEIWPTSIPCDGVPRDCFPDMMRNLFCHIGSAVVRREAFDRVGGFDDIVEFYKGRRVQGEDYDFLLRLSLETPYVGTSKVTFRYRWHEGMSSRNIVPQIIIGFKYRLRMIERLRRDSSRTALLPTAIDRMQLCWGEHIELIWSRRDLKGLRLMCQFGLKYDELYAITTSYVMRSAMPRWLVSVADRARLVKRKCVEHE